MKYFIVLTIVLFLPIVAGAQEQVQSFAPAQPKIGDVITLTYFPKAKAAVHRDATELVGEVLVVRSASAAFLVEVSMKKSGSALKGSFTLTDADAVFLLFRYVADDKVDDNGENCWYSFVYGNDKKPVRAAHLYRSSVLQAGSYVFFKAQKDPEAARKELEIEKKLYPDDYRPIISFWRLERRQNPGEETDRKIKAELEALYEKQQNNEEVVQSLLYWFEQMGEKAKAEEIKNRWITANPKGKIAETVRRTAVSAEKDPSKQVELLEAFLSDFPQKDESMTQLLAYRTIQAKQYDKASGLLAKLSSPSPQGYNSLAWALIEKGEQLEKAVEWAKRGLDLADKEEKPPYMSTRSWKKNQEQGKGMIADTYAFGLFQLGKYEEAEKAYEEAYGLTQGGDDDINARLVECYVKNGKNNEAMRVASECIKKGKSNDKLLEHYRTAYLAVKGSPEGFEKALNESKSFAKNEIKAKMLKERVNKPAVDFALKSLDGKTVKLSDLRGNVVVLDFWATWCGPCVASFPTLQKVYDKYRDNPKVMILAVNTWENEKGAKREEVVKAFMEKNKYTFPVLYDVNVVEKYGVEGIPTKFIIDQKGMIQFKDVGFGGAQEMMDKMELQFELLLSGEVSMAK